MPETPYKVAAILNPQSANGRTARALPRVREELAALAPGTAFLETQAPGHATDLTRQALLDGYTRILSVGGDGTHFEVTNGFFDGPDLVNPEASMALLPFGSGSDLAKTLGIPQKFEGLPTALSNNVIGADVCHVTYTTHDGSLGSRVFINVAHIGIGGDVAERVNRVGKCMGGFLAFLAGTIISLILYKNKHMRLDLDGVIREQRFKDVILANAQFDGGGMHVAPNARIDNGTVEAYVIGNIGRLESLRNLPRVYKGTLDERDDVDYLRIARLTATSDERVLLNLDGEQCGRLPATFEVLPGAHRIVSGRTP